MNGTTNAHHGTVNVPTTNGSSTATYDTFVHEDDGGGGGEEHEVTYSALWDILGLDWEQWDVWRR